MAVLVVEQVDPENYFAVILSIIFTRLGSFSGFVRSRISQKTVEGCRVSNLIFNSVSRWVLFLDLFYRNKFCFASSEPVFL